MARETVASKSIRGERELNMCSAYLIRMSMSMSLPESTVPHYRLLHAEVTTLLLEHQANPQRGGGLYGNALNAATRRCNIDALKVLLDEALPYEVLDEVLLQVVLPSQ